MFYVSDILPDQNLGHEWFFCKILSRVFKESCVSKSSPTAVKFLWCKSTVQLSLQFSNWISVGKYYTSILMARMKATGSKLSDGAGWKIHFALCSMKWQKCRHPWNNLFLTLSLLSLCVCPNLITEYFWDVPVVPELRSVSAQQSISGQDGNSSQNERRKQVGVDVVSGAVQLPADTTRATVMSNISMFDIQSDC